MDNEIAYGAKRGVGKTRAMVLKYHLEGLSGPQIAKKVKISRQAVNKHIARLRADGEIA